MVIDTCVIRNALEGHEDELKTIGKIVKECLTPVIDSEKIISEYSKNLDEWKRERGINRLIRPVRDFFYKLKPTEKGPPSIEIDLRDDVNKRFLEVALAEGCGFIISKNPDLYELKKYREVNIITPSEFLTRIDQN